MLGCEDYFKQDGHAEYKIRVADHLLRSHGMMHGGAISSVVDSALGLAASSVSPEGYITVTVQLNINFIRPAKHDEVLTAKADVEHRGGKTVVTYCRLTNEKEKLIATASATMMFVPIPRK